jgi:general secretion pathway protein J
LMRARRQHGFTLIELLVAISLMALMAVLSWRGLDGISRSQSQLLQRSDDVQALQVTLGQWGADLDAMAEQPGMRSVDWDGRALRILRHSSAGAGAGLQVVAWARRSVDGAGQWLRWQSPEFQTRDALDLAWQRAQVWAQTPSEDDRKREVRTVAVDDWQIYFYRGNAWTNPLSSVGASGPAPALGADATPDGVRLVLVLSPGHTVAGKITRDWVRATLGPSP